MSEFPPCPECSSEFIYEDRDMLVCPECGHEWTIQGDEGNQKEKIVKDANGQALQDGDSVIVIKDLKVKGSSSVVKGGTKVKGIRLVDGHDGHDIDCKVSGIGSIQLKSEFVKKSK